MSVSPQAEARREAARQASGQFGPDVAEEADVARLGLAPVPNGSYLYPPVLHTAVEAIAYFEQVEIPDRVMEQASARHQYETKNPPDAERLRAMRKAIGAEYDRRYPHGGGPDREAYIDDVLDSGEGMDRPDALNPPDARAVAKVAGLWIATTHLEGEEFERVLDHQVETTQGWRSVHQIMRAWRVGRYSRDIAVASNHEAWRDRVDRPVIHAPAPAAAVPAAAAADSGASEALLAEIRAMRQDLERQQDLELLSRKDYERKWGRSR